MTGTNMSNDSIELLCNHCGQTFSSFLHQMADKNEKVVCTVCRENPDCKPVKAEPGAKKRPVKKIV
jgi:hypothetical protein